MSEVTVWWPWPQDAGCVKLNGGRRWALFGEMVGVLGVSLGKVVASLS